ncbi:hypothetical protein BESB_057000 [Besnoitia besnoiti]|uniref:AP2/ERF domain-containing protein n=1 Tax=Besnoitia besnoiti TaxID=94643 RepID=A0A2A9MDT7_BESBE|nr:hypothetical protein BESB_057000 [Besnoitia besnoiti]PFH36049.1 hypothetical protein BESB_057000 [Besnoitia besnoiti]
MEDEEVGAGMLGSDHRNEGDDSCGNSVVGAAGGQALSTTAVAGTQGAASSTSLLDQPSRGFEGASTLGPRLCHTESATGGSKVSWEPSGEAQLRCPLQLQRDDLFSLTHAENTSVTGRGQRAEEGVCAFHAEDSSRRSEGDSISVGEAIELMTALQESSLLHTCNRVVEDALPDDLLRLLSLPCSANEPLESREQGGLTAHQNRGTPKEKEMRQWLQPVAAHDRETDRGDRLSATDGFVGRTGHNSQRLGLMDGYKPQEAFTPTGLLPQHTYGRPPGQDGVLVRGRRSISSGSRFTADDRTVTDANCLSTGCQIVANRHGEPLCSTDSTRSEESGSESSPSSPCNTPGACCDSPASASAKRDNNHTTVRAHAWADASLKEFEVGTAAGSSTNLIRGACTLQSGVARAECNVAARNSYGQIHRSGTANIADRAKISDYSAMHKAMPKVTGVRFQAQRNRFVAEWYERGRTRMAYFPVKLYGFDRARNMAIRRREEVLQMKLAKSNVKGDVGGSPASAHGRGNLSVRSGAVEMVTPTSKRRRLVDSYTPSATPAPCRNTFPIETATPRFTSSRRPALLPLATCESKPAKETPITEVLLRSPVRTSSERADPEAGCEVGLKRRREDHILPTLLEQQRRLWTPETTRVVAAGGAARVDARDISLCDLLERAVAAAGTQGKAHLRRRCEESFSEGLGIRPDIRSVSNALLIAAQLQKQDIIDLQSQSTSSGASCSDTDCLEQTWASAGRRLVASMMGGRTTEERRLSASIL